VTQEWRQVDAREREAFGSAEISQGQGCGLWACGFVAQKKQGLKPLLVERFKEEEGREDLPG